MTQHKVEFEEAVRLLGEQYRNGRAHLLKESGTDWQICVPGETYTISHKTFVQLANEQCITHRGDIWEPTAHCTHLAHTLHRVST